MTYVLTGYATPLQETYRFQTLEINIVITLYLQVFLKPNFLYTLRLQVTHRSYILLSNNIDVACYPHVLMKLIYSPPTTFKGNLPGVYMKRLCDSIAEHLQVLYIIYSIIITWYRQDFLRPNFFCALSFTGNLQVTYISIQGHYC